VKSERQAKIMEIISTTNVETQEQLLSALENAGFIATQATISRDIKDLRIVKELTSFGTYRYTAAARELPSTFSNRLNTIFLENGYNSVVIHRNMDGAYGSTV
jgi:transcriptional regulator of arginine metabolism